MTADRRRLTAEGLSASLEGKERVRQDQQDYQDWWFLVTNNKDLFDHVNPVNPVGDRVFVLS